MVDQNASDTTAMYFSYDVHGNVKSILQHVPGLPDKQIDYVYDLVSSKIKYAIYQYGRSDQFIHEYEYDSDNRISKVSTSSDGFVWYVESSYDFYVHGPLARQELGEYRVQGLDYFYTNQGWIKGSICPFLVIHQMMARVAQALEEMLLRIQSDTIRMIINLLEEVQLLYRIPVIISGADCSKHSGIRDFIIVTYPGWLRTCPRSDR